MKKIILVLFCLASFLFGQGVPYGVKFLLNSESDFAKRNLKFARFSNGDFLACWECWGQDWDGAVSEGIHAQVFSKVGEKIGSELVINPHAEYDEVLPIPLPLSDGKLLLAWTSNTTRFNPSGTDKGAYVQLLSNAGERIDDVFRVGLFDDGQDCLTSAAQLAGGEILFCSSIKEQPYSNDWDIQAQIFAQSMGPLLTKFRVNSYTEGTQIFPYIAPLTEGGFYVFWNSIGQDGSGYGIYGQLFDLSGGKINEEFRVNVATEGSQFLSGDILPLTDGRFLLYWESHSDTSDETELYAQVYSGSGAKLGNVINIVTLPELVRSLTSAAAMPDGSFVVTWLVAGIGGFEGYSRIFSQEGNPKGDPFRVNQISDIRIGHGPIVIPFSRGEFLTYWAGDIGNNWIFTLHGQLFDENGKRNGPEFEISEGPVDDDTRCIFVKGAADDFIITWAVPSTPSAKDYYAKRFPESPLHHELSRFRLLSPLHDASLTNTKPALIWEQPGDFTVCYPWEIHYRVFIDDNPDFSSPVIQELNKDTTCVTNALQPGTTYFWKVLAKNLDGDSLWSTNTNSLSVRPDATEIASKRMELPDQFILYSNYPNPFNAETLIRFDLPETGFAHIAIYDVQGRLVATLLREFLPAGSHSVRWNGRDANGMTMPSGIYIYRMQVQTPDGRAYVRSGKMGLVK